MSEPWLSDAVWATATANLARAHCLHQTEPAIETDGFIVETLPDGTTQVRDGDWRLTDPRPTFGNQWRVFDGWWKPGPSEEDLIAQTRWILDEPRLTPHPAHQSWLYRAPSGPIPAKKLRITGV